MYLSYNFIKITTINLEQKKTSKKTIDTKYILKKTKYLQYIMQTLLYIYSYNIIPNLH